MPQTHVSAVSKSGPGPGRGTWFFLRVTDPPRAPTYNISFLTTAGVVQDILSVATVPKRVGLASNQGTGTLTCAIKPPLLVFTWSLFHNEWLPNHGHKITGTRVSPT